MNTQIFGILNVTPDSFSDGGVLVDRVGDVLLEDALSQAMEMVLAGTDWIDVGGESTRPGAQPVPPEVECHRVLEVVQSLADRGIKVSIDTQKATVAQAALDVGAQLINDVSGFRDPSMMHLAVERQCEVCIMHMQGSPQTMQTDPTYADVVREVREFLMQQAEQLVSLGLPSEKIWIDPGIGFGKTFQQNMMLIKHIDAFVQTGLRVFVGVSRKSMLGRLAGEPPEAPNFEDRVWVGHSAHTYLLLRGVHGIRTHDVAAARFACSWVRALENTP